MIFRKQIIYNYISYIAYYLSKVVPERDSISKKNCLINILDTREEKNSQISNNKKKHLYGYMQNILLFAISNNFVI